MYRMELSLLLLLTFSSPAHSQNLQCYTGSIVIGNETWNEEDVLASLEPQVTAAVVSVANGDEHLEDFLHTQGECQIDCLVTVMRATFSTLYGKLAEDFVNYDKPDVQDTFVEAIIGAFRACYPQPPREEVRQVAETIFAGIGTEQKPSQAFPQGTVCRNEGFEDYFPVEDFLTQFDSTILEVMTMTPKLQKYYEEEAMDCQKLCIQQTVAASATTLFLTDNYEENTGIDALTGAIHACFPGIREDEISVLVSETNLVMASAVEEGNGIRKGTKKKGVKKAGSVKDALKKRKGSKRKHKKTELEENSSFWLLFGLVVVMAVVLYVGISLGKHWERSAVMSYARRNGTYQLLSSTLGISKNERFAV